MDDGETEMDFIELLHFGRDIFSFATRFENLFDEDNGAEKIMLYFNF